MRPYTGANKSVFIPEPGIHADDFVEKVLSAAGSYGESKLEVFKKEMSSYLGDSSSVTVFSIRQVPGTHNLTDVFFAANNNTSGAFYQQALLHGLVWTNKVAVRFFPFSCLSKKSRKEQSRERGEKPIQKGE